MRKYFKVLLVLMFPLALSAQTETNRFTGTWKLNIQKSVEAMDAHARQKYDSLREEVKARASASMAERLYVFNNNGTATISWKRGDERVNTQAQWELNDAQQEIALRVEGQPVYFNYTFLSDSELQLNSVGHRGIFTTLCLIKE